MSEELNKEEMQEERGFNAFLNHQMDMLNELGKAMLALFPEKFKTHTRNAGQAFVDSFKALVVIPEDEGEDKEGSDSDGNSKVKVDVN